MPAGQPRRRAECWQPKPTAADLPLRGARRSSSAHPLAPTARFNFLALMASSWQPKPSTSRDESLACTIECGSPAAPTGRFIFFALCAYRRSPRAEMGVAGLLKMISSCVHEVELSAYRGRKIAVDASCWLHRGTFACPIELAAGEPTDKFLGYCERMIELMRQHGVTPVLVFDGAPPPMKARLNEERRAQRAAQREKAEALL